MYIHHDKEKASRWVSFKIISHLSNSNISQGHGEGLWIVRGRGPTRRQSINLHLD